MECKSTKNYPIRQFVDLVDGRNGKAVKVERNDFFKFIKSPLIGCSISGDFLVLLIVIG